jgi:hypothetical protein
MNMYVCIYTHVCMYMYTHTHAHTKLCPKSVISSDVDLKILNAAVSSAERM